MDLTPSQVKAFEVFHRIKMAYIALYCVLALFSIGFLSFLWAIFFVDSQGTPKAMLGGLDALLGFVMHRVYAHLFPNGKART